jgi:hypothetical protein
VRYVAGQQTMTIIGADFTPNGSVVLSALSKAKPTPTIFASSQVQPTGIFLQSALPPAFSSPNRTLESFTLLASDSTNPAAPLLASFAFQVVRFGLTTKPAPKRPTSKVTYTADRVLSRSIRIEVAITLRGFLGLTAKWLSANGACLASTEMWLLAVIRIG